MPTVSLPVPVSGKRNVHDPSSVGCPHVDMVHKMLTFQSGNEEIDLVAFGVRPALDDCCPKLDVGLVHLGGLAYVDLGEG